MTAGVVKACTDTQVVSCGSLHISSSLGVPMLSGWSERALGTSGFRNVAFGSIAVVAISIGLIVLYSQEAKNEARDSISASELEIQDIRLQAKSLTNIPHVGSHAKRFE